MITMHAHPRHMDGQTDRQTNTMAIARQFILTNASHANEATRLHIKTFSSKLPVSVADSAGYNIVIILNSKG